MQVAPFGGPRPCLEASAPPTSLWVPTHTASPALTPLLCQVAAAGCRGQVGLAAALVVVAMAVAVPMQLVRVPVRVPGLQIVRLAAVVAVGMAMLLVLLW